jgi:hypothetical protein
MGERGLDLSSSGQGQVADCCEDGNELLVCIPWGEKLLVSRGGLCSIHSASLLVSGLA